MANTVARKREQQRAPKANAQPISSAKLLVGAFVLLAATVGAFNIGTTNRFAAPELESGTPASEKLPLSKSAQTAYVYANTELANKNFEGALRYYDEAIEFQPDFLEAIYHRGVVKTQVAVHRARQNRIDAAVEIYREALEDKREAQALIDKDSWYIFQTAREQAPVVEEVLSALKDADEALTDESALRKSLLAQAHPGR